MFFFRELWKEIWPLVLQVCFWLLSVSPAFEWHMRRLDAVSQLPASVLCFSPLFMFFCRQSFKFCDFFPWNIGDFVSWLQCSCLDVWWALALHASTYSFGTHEVQFENLLWCLFVRTLCCSVSVPMNSLMSSRCAMISCIAPCLLVFWVDAKHYGFHRNECSGHSGMFINSFGICSWIESSYLGKSGLWGSCFKDSLRVSGCVFRSSEQELQCVLPVLRTGGRGSWPPALCSYQALSLWYI